jgi:acyl carrier protein
MSDFYDGMSEILEVSIDKLSPDFDLNSGESPWDSLAIVSTIALVDDCFNVMLNGQSLGECKSIFDIENLIEAVKNK